MKWAIVGIMVIVLAPRLTLAGCRLVAANDTIWVTDFPREAPCTLKTLLCVDRMNDWDRIAYDPTNDTYTVNAHLWIGRNDGTETYFQIGSANHPSETLVLNGNLAVYPYFVKGENPSLTYKSRRCVNRVILGVPDNPAVRATLKIVSAKTNEHTLYVGAIPGRTQPGRQCGGGELHVYNSTITAAIQDKDHAFGGRDYIQNTSPQVVTYGAVVMRNAVMSWYRGVATWGLRQDAALIENSVFEHGDYAMVNSGWSAKGCVFRDLFTAVGDWGGALDTVLTDCVFSNNQANWKLRVPGSRLIAVDCAWDAPRAKNRYTWEAKKSDKSLAPVFSSRRHLIVAVTDTNGAPVANATVEIACEQNVQESMVILGRAVTDSTGRTPGQGSSKALLLSEFMERATAVPDQPEHADYTYTLTVKAPGYGASIVTGLKPDKSWATQKVVLGR